MTYRVWVVMVEFQEGYNHVRVFATEDAAYDYVQDQRDFYPAGAVSTEVFEEAVSGPLEEI